MELILWRHAEAEDGVPDHGRQLTAKGMRQAKKMAGFLRTHLPRDTRILVSPAVRTQQTIQPLADKFETVPEVGPGASYEAVLDAAGWPDKSKSVLIVGHQPYLGEIAALLLAGVSTSFSIKKGAVWWLSQRERDGNSETTLRLAISPDLL
jgi:phosphohistidine phosphatase